MTVSQVVQSQKSLYVIPVSRDYSGKDRLVVNYGLCEAVIVIRYIVSGMVDITDVAIHTANVERFQKIARWKAFFSDEYYESPIRGTVGRGYIDEYVKRRRQMNRAEAENPTVYVTDIPSATAAGTLIRLYEPYFANALWYSILPYELDQEEIQELETGIRELLG